MGGGVIMNTDKDNTITTQVDETIKDTKSRKPSNRDMVKKMYLDDNKNYEEISEELGIAINTVKLYISQGGYSKNSRRKRKDKTPKEEVDESDSEDKIEPEEIEDEERPYMDIGNGYVVYEGKLMKKMTKEEFVKAMIEDRNRRFNE